MPKKLFVLGLLSLGLLGGTFACSGATVLTDGTTTTDGGTTPDANGPSDGGTDLVPTGSTKAVVKISGGFTGPGGDGSTCHAADDTYTLDLGTKALAWKVCRADDSTDASAPVLGYVTGNKTLGDADFTSVSAKMHALTRATQTGCGADAPEETITFTSPAGDTTLYDDFYFCDAKDPKIYVTNLNDVISALSDLAK